MPSESFRMDSVIFVVERETNSSLEPGSVVISPNEDKWNDFGFQIRVDVFFADANLSEHGLLLPGYFGFFGGSGNETDVRLLKKLLQAAPDGRLGSSQLPKFFMMLPDMRSYREIVSRLGPERAVRALVAMNDVVAADEGFPSSISLSDVKETREFKLAFLRSSEAFFAWTNAGPILRGLENEQVDRMSSTFNIRFQLDGRPNEHELSFRFDAKNEVLPRRFVVVIGKNGVGKSQTLRNIAKAALGSSKDLTDGDGGRPALNRVLAFAATQATSSVFPSERQRNPRVWYRRFVLGYSGGPRARRTTSELIIQLARSEERVHDRDRLQLFLTAITAIDNWEELGLRANREHGDIISLAALRGGGEQERIIRFGAIDGQREPVRVIDGKAYPLSSGEQSFLRFAAIASLHIENGTLVLLDEPETHLHPNFISQFVAVLDNLLEQTGSAAIIATHSVYFVRETFEDQVIVLRSEKDRTIVADRPKLKTFGADVGSISYFVFGEDQPSRLAQKVEKRIADDSTSWLEAFGNYKDDLSLDLLGEIRARIEPPTPVRRA